MKKLKKTLDAAALHLIATALEDSQDKSALGKSGLWVSDQPCPNLGLLHTLSWSKTSPQNLLQSPWQKRHDLAVTWLSAELPWQDVLHLLSALRDLHARQLLAFVPAAAWSEQNALAQTDSLRALGLQQQARFQQGDDLIEAWSFDIRTYKTVPDWLNPRFWANPENWNKYRW